MSESNASEATTPRGSNTGIKYEAEGKDFWYQLCVIFEASKESKYENCMADFLDHEDSGPLVRKENKYRKKMSRYYKQIKEGKLTAGMGQKKRTRSRNHEDIEEALIREIRGMGAAMPKKKDMRKMAIQIAVKLGKGDTFKASQVWLENVAKRIRIQVHYSSPTDPIELQEDECNVIDHSDGIESRSTLASARQPSWVSPSSLPELDVSDLEFDVADFNAFSHKTKIEWRETFGEDHV